MKKDIFNMYASRVAEKFHLTLDEMFVKNKTRDIVDSRQILFYLCVQRPIRISYIQKFLKDNGLELSHSTIIHGYKHAQKMIKEIIKTFKYFSVEKDPTNNCLDTAIITDPKIRTKKT